MFDTRTWELVKTVNFPAGSQPYMLRVSPDGKEVWVQTGKVDENIVLSAEDLSTLATMPTGKGRSPTAWTPDGKLLAGRQFVATRSPASSTPAATRKSRG